MHASSACTGQKVHCTDQAVWMCGWQLQRLQLPSLLQRLKLVRDAFKWGEIPRRHVTEALEGDAQILAAVHLNPTVKMRLKAARMQNAGRRNLTTINLQMLDNALAVIIAAAEECGVQPPATGAANNKRMPPAQMDDDGPSNQRKKSKKEDAVQPRAGGGQVQTRQRKRPAEKDKPATNSKRNKS